MSTRLWHGFADMHGVKDNEIVFRAADGVWLETVDGRRILDATAALWYCAVGYGRNEIADAAADQMRRLPAYSSFGAFTTEPTVALAERLAATAPMDDAVVFFTSGGSESVETAAKLARRYWDVMGKPGKRVIVSREHSYHGMAAYGTSLAGMPGNKAGYGGALIDEVAHAPADDVDELERLISSRSAEIAAFIAEPMIGAGGVYAPSPTYWAEVNRICKLYDVLLIADEVITGFGRLGTMWGSERYGIKPDMVTFAKAVTSGYVPLGGVLVGSRVRAPFWDDPVPGAVFRHGYTYTGHSVACAAAQANLDIIEREQLVDRCGEMEPVIASRVGTLRTAPLVGEVRAVGLTAAVALRPDVLSADPTTIDAVVAAAYRHGVATRVLRGHALHISPAFTISSSEIDTMVNGLGDALAEVASARGVS